VDVRVDGVHPARGGDGGIEVAPHHREDVLEGAQEAAEHVLART
jgi:hypothetical protein